MWETIEPSGLSVFGPFVLFAPLPLKIAPKRAIPPTLRTTAVDCKQSIVHAFIRTQMAGHLEDGSNGLNSSKFTVRKRR